MTTLRDETTPKQLATLNLEYGGSLLSRQDIINILLFIGTTKTIERANILKNPPRFHPEAQPPRGSYLNGKLYKLIQTM